MVSILGMIFLSFICFWFLFIIITPAYKNPSFSKLSSDQQTFVISIICIISVFLSYIFLFHRHKYWIEFIWKVLMLPFLPLWILLITRNQNSYRLYISFFFLFLFLLSIPMYFTETSDEMWAFTSFCFGITTSILITLEFRGLTFWTIALLLCISLLLIVTSYGFINLFLLFAYAFFPRNIELKRYFSSGIPSISNQSKQTSAFTLIELLIVIAIMGIVMVGISSSLSLLVNTTKTVSVKTEITHVLSSEMDLILSMDDLPSPSTTTYPLPIPIERFTQHENLQGNYNVEETNEPGLVKITVQLTESLPNSVSRNYSMISYRRGSYHD